MKVGQKVSWTRRNGEVAYGKTVGAPAIRGKGEFIECTMVDEKNKAVGKTTFVRPSELTKR